MSSDTWHGACVMSDTWHEDCVMRTHVGHMASHVSKCMQSGNYV